MVKAGGCLNAVNIMMSKRVIGRQLEWQECSTRHKWRTQLKNIYLVELCTAELDLGLANLQQQSNQSILSPRELFDSILTSDLMLRLTPAHFLGAGFISAITDFLVGTTNLRHSLTNSSTAKQHLSLYILSLLPWSSVEALQPHWHLAVLVCKTCKRYK